MGLRGAARRSHDAVGHFSDLFDRDALERATLLDGTTGRRGLFLLPMGFATHHVHAWKSLLELAGFTVEDIPADWDPFWAFWCDQVSPRCVRHWAVTTSGPSGCPCRRSG
jgi:multiple sugar transport system substrate-binding protein